MKSFHSDPVQRNVVFFHLKCNFVLTNTPKTNKNKSNGIIEFVILQRGEHSCDFVDKNLLCCCFARYCFYCSVDRAFNVAALSTALGPRARFFPLRTSRPVNNIYLEYH